MTWRELLDVGYHRQEKDYCPICNSDIFFTFDKDDFVCSNKYCSLVLGYKESIKILNDFVIKSNQIGGWINPIRIKKFKVKKVNRKNRTFEYWRLVSNRVLNLRQNLVGEIYHVDKNGVEMYMDRVDSAFYKNYLTSVDEDICDDELTNNKQL